MAADTTEIPFAETGGFKLILALTGASPAPAPGAPASGPPGTPPPPRTALGSRVGQVQGTVPAAAPPTGPPAPVATAGTPLPKPSETPFTGIRAGASAHPNAVATPSGPKITTKMTIYPDDAPAAPTPQPTGNVQSYGKRVALARGWVDSAVDLKLYSLAAAHFAIPTSEQTKSRGFTIALFQSAKHRKSSVLAWDANASLSGNVVSVMNENDPITLKKHTGYFFVLYGDDIGPVATPQGAYPGANNPALNGSPGPGGVPLPPGAPTPVPSITPFPQSSNIIGPH